MDLKQAKFVIIILMASQSLFARNNTGIFEKDNSPINSNEHINLIDADKVLTSVNVWETEPEKGEQELKIRINRGRKFTNKREIEVEIRPLKISATLVSKMKIGFQPDLSDAEWEPFKFNKFLSVPEGEGEIIIYAMLKDKAGNNSSVEKDIIIVDITPPSDGQVVINKGAEFTNDPEMRVRLSIQAKEAYKMQISNTADFKDAEWEDFVPERNWMIGPRKEGTKTVYVRFADKATNISQPVNASIKVDLTPPVGEVIINDGEKFTNKRKVTLKITADDATVVRIVGDNIQNVPFVKNEDGVLIKEWKLDSIQGQKFVKVYFRDNAGNISTKPVLDDIILDSKPPQIGLFRINMGDKYCTNPEGRVTLQIATREKENTFKMYVSNSPDFEGATAMDYKPKIDGWQLLTEQDGIKTVYLKFIDEAGNVSKIANAKVFLDRQPPIPGALIIEENSEWINKNYSSLHMEADDADFMEISNSPTFSQISTWETYSQTRQNWALPARDGKIEVFVRFKDIAGNISSTVTDFIYKDTKAPMGKLTINDNARFTNNTAKTVDISLAYDEDAYEMQINNNPNFNNVAWQPIQETIEGWNLEGEDGDKRVFARYKDKAGNISDIIAAGIILDTQAPQFPAISINGDSAFATSMEKNVLVTLSAEDASHMMVSTSASFKNAKWETFSTEKGLILPGGDGEKEVFAKYKDEAGNISAVVSSKIIVDRYPPKPVSFFIDNDAEWTNSNDKKVTLKIKAEDAHEMIIADSPDFSNAEWQPYKTSINYTLSGEDGDKQLYIAFKDQAGHTSKSLSDSIKLKREF